MSAAPSRSPAPQRPWYLLVALIAAWILGAQSMNAGCTLITFYRGEHVFGDVPDELTDSAARARVTELVDQMGSALDAARGHLLPMAIAGLILGAAMVMLAARAISGRAGARGPLVQVTIVRAAVAVASYLFSAEARGVDIVHATTIAATEHAPPWFTRAIPIFPRIQLVLSTLACALVVLALTRPRSRAFFEAAARQSFSEP